MSCFCAADGEEEVHTLLEINSNVIYYDGADEDVIVKYQRREDSRHEGQQEERAGRGVNFITNTSAVCANLHLQC